jgi:hypothetical protein
MSKVGRKLGFTLVRQLRKADGFLSARSTADSKVIRPVRVGVLDLGAWIGEMADLLGRLNRSQSLFTIFEVQAPVPGGLIKSSEGMAHWAAAQGILKPLPAFEKHVIADEFFVAAEDIREDLDLSFIVGITPAMVAGTSPDGAYWNYVSAGVGKTILLSTRDLRDFAAQANRPFAAAVGTLLVSTLLAGVNEQLIYHENTGCIFDFNENRISFVDTFKALRIEESCLDKMTSDQRQAATAMVTVLRRMRRRNR